MKLTVLGAGDAFGSGGRRQSAYLVQIPGATFLMDAGPSLLAGLEDAHVDPTEIDFILLSHLHGDHFGGIPFLFLQSTFESPRERELLIAGPEGTEERVHALFRAMYAEAAKRPIPFPLRFETLRHGQESEFKGVRIQPFLVPHQIVEPSLGLRIEADGKTLVYSGDSAWTDDFIRMTKDVDLFLCECTYWDCEAPIHINYQEFSKHRSRLSARRVILSHLGPRMLDNLDRIEVETAYDGLVVEI